MSAQAVANIIGSVPELASFYASVPKYADAGPALQRLAALEKERAGELKAALDAYDALVDRAVAAVLIGDELPDGLENAPPPAPSRATMSTTGEPTNLDRKIVALRKIANRIKSARDQAVLDALDPALEHLHKHLTDVIATAREHADVATMAADAAIDARKADEWALVNDLRRQYERLRVAQRALYTAVQDQTYRHHEYRFAAVRNLPEAYPTWFAWRPFGSDVPQGFAMVNDPARSPWGEDHSEMFDWFAANHAAEPWIPTRPQLRTAVDEATQDAREGQRRAAAESKDPDPFAIARASQEVMDARLRKAARGKSLAEVIGEGVGQLAGYAR